MRACIRCGEPMEEELDLKVEAAGYGLKLTRKGVFGERLEKPKVAVCPKCGEISLYVEHPERLS